MPAAGIRRWPRAAGDGGFTLVEMLVAAAAGIVVISGLVLVLSSVLRAQPAQQERAGQIQEGRVALERVVRELRQGSPVTGAVASSTQVTVDTFTRGGCNGSAPTTSAVVCRVTYTCAQSGATATCTRRAGTATPRTAITGLASPQVFSYGATATPDCNLSSVAQPTFVCLSLTYPGTDGAESVTVEDSAYLRNPAA